MKPLETIFTLLTFAIPLAILVLLIVFRKRLGWKKFLILIAASIPAYIITIFVLFFILVEQHLCEPPIDPSFVASCKQQAIEQAERPTQLAKEEKEEAERKAQREREAAEQSAKEEREAAERKAQKEKEAAEQSAPGPHADDDAWSDMLSAKFRMFDCLLGYQLRDGVYGKNYEDFKQKLLRPVEERCGREYLAAWTKIMTKMKNDSFCATDTASSCALAGVDTDVAEMLGCWAEGEGGSMVPIICRRARMKAP